MGSENELTISLPEDGRAREILRIFETETHGEFVVVLNWKGEIIITLYPIGYPGCLEKNANLRSKSYKIKPEELR